MSYRGRDWWQDQQLTLGQETLPRHLVGNGALTLSTGNERIACFTARKSETVSQVRTISAVAGVGSTLCRIGLFTANSDGTFTLVASTPNDTTLWAAANTRYTKAFSASYALKAGRRYGVGCLQVGGSTSPTIAGCSTIAAQATEVLEPPILAAVVFGQADLASLSAAAYSGSTNAPYAVLLP